MTDVAPFGKSLSLQDAEGLGAGFFKRPELAKAYGTEVPEESPTDGFKSPEHHLVEKGWHGTTFHNPHKERTTPEHHYIVDMHHKEAHKEPKTQPGEVSKSLFGASAASLMHGHHSDWDDHEEHHAKLTSASKAGKRYVVVSHDVLRGPHPEVSSHKNLQDALNKYHSNVNHGQNRHEEAWQADRKSRGGTRSNY